MAISKNPTNVEFTAFERMHGWQLTVFLLCIHDTYGIFFTGGRWMIVDLEDHLFR